MGPVLSKAHVANVERFREKVLNGGARMPGYKLALGDEQINQVIAYMQTVDAPLTRLAAAHPGE
jgi:mono/diheme cytochrome c family protein